MADNRCKSSSGNPAKKRSEPTSVRSAKLASKDARGDPIPITVPSRSTAPKRSSASLFVASLFKRG